MQRCMAETSSSDFVDWQIYFEQQLNTHEKLDYYLAQIAAEVRRGWVKSPKQVKSEDFLIKFERKGASKTSEAPATDDEKQKYLAESKAFFSALLKMPPRKPPTKKPVAANKKKKEKADGRRPHKRTGNPANPAGR